jgi:hypothetical protein
MSIDTDKPEVDAAEVSKHTTRDQVRLLFAARV